MNIKSWQLKQWHYLTKRFAEGNLPHALLFSGIKRLGKQQFAFHFSNYLLCTQRGEFYCGRCRACQLMHSYTHPDFFIIQPEEKSEVIKVDQIRSLIERLSSTAQYHGLQIAVINLAESMNISASNALLKTLEEPLGKVLLILLTEQPAFLPATVRSRCQLVNFFPPDNIAADQWLFNQQDGDENIIIYNALCSLQEGGLDPMEFARQFAQNNIEQLLTIWQLFYLDLNKIQHGAKKDQISINDSYIQMDRIAKHIGEKAIFTCFDKLSELKIYLRNNLNRQLLLEDMALFVGNLHVS